jgi:hypothetical protein
VADDEPITDPLEEIIFQLGLIRDEVVAGFDALREEVGFLNDRLRGVEDGQLRRSKELAS